MRDKKKITVIMPAYKAEKTLEATYKEIPEGRVNEVILVDDYGKDKTAEIARRLGIITIVHEKNKGYGGNQKTCYTEALKRGADIVVMLHPDHQYDPTKIPELIKPLMDEKADIAYGSRMLPEKGAEKGRMPQYKQMGNRMLTFYYNIMLGTRLTDAATGYIAYTRKVLETVPFEMNSDGYTFDEEMIIQCVSNRFRLIEVPIPTKYEKESHTISFRKAIGYGGKLFLKVLRYKLHQIGIRSMQFSVRENHPSSEFRDGS
ncbi:glycosyltransferase family 2 protein [Candidatus Woesearchaeota archaeon]|nr:glycosyltransferase family 2 protein [Candidatus Woesearchaeota archaeon]